MSEEKTLVQRKMQVKKAIAIILLIAIAVSIVSGFVLYREHKLRRASVSFEGISFDGMYFEVCTDYKLSSTFEPTKIICKSTDGDWTIKAVEGYEENYEYVYLRSTFDGKFYERVE